MNGNDLKVMDQCLGLLYDVQSLSLSNKKIVKQLRKRITDELAKITVKVEKLGK